MRKMRFICSFLFIGFLLLPVSSYQIAVQRAGRLRSTNAATRSPLFRPSSWLPPRHELGPRLPDFLMHKAPPSRPQSRIPAHFMSVAFAVLVLACTGTNNWSPGVAHAARDSGHAVPMTTRQRSDAIEETTKSSSKFRKGATIVMVAGGTGALVGTTLRPKKQEKLTLDDDILQDFGSAVVDSKLETGYSYEKAAEKKVGRMLERAMNEDERSLATPVAMATHQDASQRELLDKPLSTAAGNSAKPAGTTPIIPVQAEEAPLRTSAVTLSNKVKSQPSTNLLRRTMDKSASLAKTLAPRFQNKYITQTLDDPELCEKYAEIESVEDRAFAVLLDLNLVERTPDPDNPDYKYAKNEANEYE